MRTSRNLTSALILTFMLAALTLTGQAADPGSPFDADNSASGQKAGSVLFFNFYTSDATSSTTQNTCIYSSSTAPRALRLISWSV